MAALSNDNTVFGYFSSETQAEAAVREITNTESREETVRREELRVENDQDERFRKAS